MNIENFDKNPEPFPVSEDIIELTSEWGLQVDIDGTLLIYKMVGEDRFFLALGETNMPRNILQEGVNLIRSGGITIHKPS